MRRELAFGVLLLAGLAVTTSAGKVPVPKEIPVTVTFTDGGYAIQSDGLGAYSNGANGVRAVLVSAGNLALDTGSARSLLLDFGVCASESCAPPFEAQEVTAFLGTSACQYRTLRDMPIDGSQACNLNVNFGTPGTGWFIRFGETTDTAPAIVTRTTSGWTIDVPADGVAKLQSYPTKGRFVLTLRGYFVMPVHLTVMQP